MTPLATAFCQSPKSPEQQAVDGGAQSCSATAMSVAGVVHVSGPPVRMLEVPSKCTAGFPGPRPLAKNTGRSVALLCVAAYPPPDESSHEATAVPVVIPEAARENASNQSVGGTGKTELADGVGVNVCDLDGDTVAEEVGV